MSGPAIFQPGDPEISRNPIFNPDQNVATGLPNVPGQFAGAASALSQLVQLQQARKDEALGKLARIHAAIDAGLYPQTVMDTPEVQALFPQAGLDALAHQKLLPKNSDTVVQQRQNELETPIFSQTGTPGSRVVTGLPPQSALNTEAQKAIDTSTAEVARAVGGQPSPQTAVIKNATAPIEAQNEQDQARIEGDKIRLEAQAVQDGEQRYKTDKYFRSFVQELHAGVERPYIEALKQQIANSGLEKQAQGNATTLLGQALQSAPSTFEAEHKDWLDRQSQERASYAQSLALSDISDKDKDDKITDHMIQWNSQHHEPTLEGVVSRSWEVTAKSLGMTPEDATTLLLKSIHIERPGNQQRLHTGPNRSTIIGSIIQQAKHDPQHITFDPGDGKGPITVSLSQLYGPHSLLTKAEIDYVQQSLAGRNPKLNIDAGAGQGGSSRRPVSPVSQVP